MNRYEQSYYSASHLTRFGMIATCDTRDASWNWNKTWWHGTVECRISCPIWQVPPYVRRILTDSLAEYLRGNPTNNINEKLSEAF